jgi:hypothetical protein
VPPWRVAGQLYFTFFFQIELVSYLKNRKLVHHTNIVALKAAIVAGSEYDSWGAQEGRQST